MCVYQFQKSTSNLTKKKNAYQEHQVDFVFEIIPRTKHKLIKRQENTELIQSMQKIMRNRIQVLTCHNSIS